MPKAHMVEATEPGGLIRLFSEEDTAPANRRPKQPWVMEASWRALLAGAMLLSVACVTVTTAPTNAGTATGPHSPRVAAKAGHRIVYQISGNDPQAMQHALSSVDNAIKLYRARGEAVTVEIVANGGGVHMMRADTTPVAPMLRYIRETYPDLVLTACGTTKTIMEKNEGKAVTLLEGVRVVPAGIVRVVELQEQGYAYVKP